MVRLGVVHIVHLLPEPKPPRAWHEVVFYWLFRCLGPVGPRCSPQLGHFARQPPDQARQQRRNFGKARPWLSQPRIKVAGAIHFQLKRVQPRLRSRLA